MSWQEQFTLASGLSWSDTKLSSNDEMRRIAGGEDTDGDEDDDDDNDNADGGDDDGKYENKDQLSNSFWNKFLTLWEKRRKKKNWPPPV